MSANGHHPSRRRSNPRRPARLTIDVVEGRGIWLELDGSLTDGSLDQVSARLERLADLGFEVVVLGARGIKAIDGAGSRLLVAFVDRVVDRCGAVVIVDPHGHVRPIADGLGRATITCEPPDGPWWLR